MEKGRRKRDGRSLGGRKGKKREKKRGGGEKGTEIIYEMKEEKEKEMCKKR